MKRFTMFVSGMIHLFATAAFALATGANISIDDQAGVLNESQRSMLSEKMFDLQENAGVIPFLRVVNSASDVSAAAAKSFANLGASGAVDDDRLVIFVSVAESSAAIETGPALQKQFPAQSRETISKKVIEPELKLGRTYEALDAGLQVIKEVRLNGSNPADFDAALQKQGVATLSGQKMSQIVFVANLLPAIVLALVWFMKRRDKSRHQKLTLILKLIVVFDVLMGAGFAFLTSHAVGPELRFTIAMNLVFNPVVCGLIALFTFAGHIIWGSPNSQKNET